MCYCRSILYFCQDTSSSKAGMTYNVSATASEFDESICKILPSFHALTRSDVTKVFIVIQKYKASKKMLTLPSAINLLSSLATVRVDVQGLTNLMFACTDFCECKMVLRA